MKNSTKLLYLFITFGCYEEIYSSEYSDAIALLEQKITSDEKQQNKNIDPEELNQIHLLSGIQLIQEAIQYIGHQFYQDSHGNTILHYAAYKRDFKLVRELTKIKACPVNIKNNAGLTVAAILDMNTGKNGTGCINLHDFFE